MSHVFLYSSEAHAADHDSCFFAVKSKLDQRLGFFNLIVCDFMLDTDFKVRGEFELYYI